MLARSRMLATNFMVVIKLWPCSSHNLVVAMSHPLASIDTLSAEQQAKLVEASQKARPSEEYRIEFASVTRQLRQRRDKRRQD
jgi:hypothetical protein